MSTPFFEVENRRIGIEHPPFVIAEVGINHEGSLEKAFQMVDDAARVGAECVKFQRHVIEDEMIPNDVIPGNAEESIWDIMERCALTFEEEVRLKEYVKQKGLIYLSTPFSRAAADELESMKVSWYKIGSGECNNYPLIRHVASFGKPMIVSTGMNDLASIRPTVEILEESKLPYSLLHCTSMYPTPYNKVRLGALSQMRDAFPKAILGLSDHSIGNYTCFGAVPMGAAILEKHFTSSKEWPGPDIPISIDPEELGELAKGTKAIWEAMGGEKGILAEEQPTIDFAYACVVTIKEIEKGETFSMDNLWVKRPGTGEIKAKDFEGLIGKRAVNNLKVGQQLKWLDVNE
jgi:sialic acid synthase SpsE